MPTYINKDNQEETFDCGKIKKAITKAMRSGSGVYNPKLAALIAEECEEKFNKKEYVAHTEVDKFVLKKLNDYGQAMTANAYERYKTLKLYQMTENSTDADIYGIIDGTNSAVKRENANKDARRASTQRDLMVGVISRSYTERNLIPTHLLAAHIDGLIHIHDTDYMINPITNCQLINLKEMLSKGTVINGNLIRPPKSFQTACTVATQISLQVANGQYGGQTFSTAHLAPFVRVSHKKWTKKYKEELPDLSDEKILELVDKRVREEVKSGVQTIQFQENTFSSSNGQTPFVSIFMHLNEEPEYIKENAMIIEEMLNLRYEGMENEDGVRVTPAFPKLLYVLDENNVPADSEYRYLTDLAVKCSAKRMNPDYISAKVMKQYYEGNVFPCMGCRSFLAPWKDENGNYKFYGRFNRGVVTINLVDVALSANKDEEKFWAILDERLELVKEALILRDTLLRGTNTNVSPIHWQHGSIARLSTEDVIDRYFDNGYSSISLGYIGLYEMTLAMKGVSHTDPIGKEFALHVMQHLNDKANEWKTQDHLHGCSVYGTPSESLCYKFALKTRKRFGEIKNITDRDWFTNSYHVSVFEPIDAFTKLTFEGEFQKLSKGGCVSYVELPDLTNNLKAVNEVIEHIYNTNVYAEVNLTGGDYCGNCGYEGEIKIVDGKWTCPKCGSQNTNKMSIARRVCGYVNSSTDVNAGKMAEFQHRVKHL